MPYWFANKKHSTLRLCLPQYFTKVWIYVIDTIFKIEWSNKDSMKARLWRHSCKEHSYYYCILGYSDVSFILWIFWLFFNVILLYFQVCVTFKMSLHKTVNKDDNQGSEKPTRS